MAAVNNVTIVNGNLLDSIEQYIVHQCNCKTTYAKGLAYHVFKKYPYTECYGSRNGVTLPGTIEVHSSSETQRGVINLFGQDGPGKAKYYGDDTTINREQWFSECLEQISIIPDLKSIAFPFNIGCGLAGGNWENYSKIIYDFAAKIKIPVVLYKLG